MQTNSRKTGVVFILLMIIGGLALVNTPAQAQIKLKANNTCFGKKATIVGNKKDNRIKGTPGRDVIVSRAGDDAVLGRGGNDLICTGAGKDKVEAGSGNDKIRLSKADDKVKAGAGNDKIYGDNNDDAMLGQAGKDTFFGGNGEDTCLDATSEEESSSCQRDDTEEGPEAVNDEATTDEDTAVNVYVLKNDIDNDGDNQPLKVVAVDTEGLLFPTQGQVTINENERKVRYNPNGQFEDLNAGETAIDFFTYTVRDSNNNESTAIVGVQITGVNDGPQAEDDQVTVDEDSFRNELNLLGNDDVEESSTITSFTQPENGTVAYAGEEGSVDTTDLVYTPDLNYCNSTENNPISSTDNFTYTVDGTSTANVEVTVNCVEDGGPEAVNDEDSTDEDSEVNVNVLENDSDPDPEQSIVVDSVNQSETIGQVTVNDNDTVTYDPDNQFEDLGATDSESDSFTYTTKDDNGNTDTAEVVVTINGVDDASVAVNDNDIITEDSGTQVINARANDTDVDGPVAEYVGFTQANHGTVVITGTEDGIGELRYTADEDYCNLQGDDQVGELDSFTYTLAGGSEATVKVAVSCVEDGGIQVQNDTYNLEANSTNTLEPLINDFEPDPEQRPIEIYQLGTQQGANGSLSRNNDGTTLRYVTGNVAEGQTVTDYVYYNVRNQRGNVSQDGVITINISGPSGIPGGN